MAATTNSNTRSDFGQYLHKIRTEVFEDSLRDFAVRVDLSPSYLNKLELSDGGTPRRETVLKIAKALGMEPDAMLLKAGYVPAQPQRGENDEYMLLLIGTLDPGQQQAVREFIKLVKDTGISIPSDES